MIKKFNKLMDDIPLIFKLIIGVIMCGIITLMGMILFFFFLPEVNAAAVNPNSNQIYAELLNGTNPEYITIGQNQEYTLPITKKSNLFVSNFINLGTGVYKGTAYIKYYNLQGETCAQIKNATNRIVLSLNDIEVVGTKQIPACSISDNYVTIKIDYSYTNMQTNGTFKLIYRLPSWNSGFKYLMNSTLDYEQKDYATNTDIENQTISIINNAIQNALDQVQQSIQNRILIENAINTATSQIQNAINNQNTKCENYNYERNRNERTGDIDGYLNSNGTIRFNSNTATTTKLLRVNKNVQYTITTTYNTTLRYCLYDKERELIQCKAMNGTTTNNITPTQEGYIRFSYEILEGDNTIFTGQLCQDRTDAEIYAIDNMNITISTKLQEAFDMEEENAEEQKGLLQSIISGISGLFSFFDDDDIDDPDNALSGLNNEFAQNNVISSLLLLPVSLYQNILNNINGNCNTFNLGSLYGHNLTMTCIQPQTFLGSTLYSVIDIIISGFFILHIRKKFVDIFLHLTSLRTGGNELE